MSFITFCFPTSISKVVIILEKAEKKIIQNLIWQLRVIFKATSLNALNPSRIIRICVRFLTINISYIIFFLLYVILIDFVLK